MTQRIRSFKRLAGPLRLWAKIVLPTLVVLAVVVAAARIKGWPLVPFLPASGPSHDPDDWCPEHGVPESLCTLCHPELKDKLLLCNEHGLPEALCTLCHPELAKRFVMCAEHGLPESFCTLCNPPVADSGQPPDWCAEHGVPRSKCTLCNDQLVLALCAEHGLPESLCTLCHPELAKRLPTCQAHGLPPAFCPACRDSQAGAGKAPPLGRPPLLPKGPESVALCRLDLPLVKLASPQTAADAGIEAVPVQTRSLDRTLTCTGQAGYQQNRYASVRPRVEGILREVHADVGAKVRRGDVLAVVDSATLGATKAGYLSARASLRLAEKNFARLQKLARQQIVPGKTLIEVETRLSETRIDLSNARQRLLNLGISSAQIDQFAEANDTSSLLPITAPMEGVVVRRKAVSGEAVEATTELFAVADLSTMWVHLNLHEDDLRWVRPGQPVSFAVESQPGDGFQGKITWINSEVDARTRTIQVRAEVDNTAGMLRSGMYGTGVIQIEAPRATQVVPKLAVQRHRLWPVVFVKKAEDLFEPRRVNIGRKVGAFWEITAGLNPHDLVVTTGSFLLKTELSKGSIGAGCCGD